MYQQNYFVSKELNNHPFNSIYKDPNTASFEIQQINFGNLPIPRDFYPYVTNIAQGIISYLSKKLQNNSNDPGIIYQWNEFCNNNFQNKEVVDLISLCCGSAGIGIMKGFFNNIEQALYNAIPYVVDRRFAFTAINIPQLFQSYDSNKQRQLQQHAQEYQRDSFEIANFLNQTVYGQQINRPNMMMGNMQPNHMFGNMFNNTGGMMQNMNQSFNNLVNTFRNQPNNTMSQSVQQSGVFNQGSHMHQQQNTFKPASTYIEPEDKEFVDIDGILNLLPEEERKEARLRLEKKYNIQSNSQSNEFVDLTPTKEVTAPPPAPPVIQTMDIETVEVKSNTKPGSVGHFPYVIRKSKERRLVKFNIDTKEKEYLIEEKEDMDRNQHSSLYYQAVKNASDAKEDIEKERNKRFIQSVKDVSKIIKENKDLINEKEPTKQVYQLGACVNSNESYESIVEAINHTKANKLALNDTISAMQYYFDMEESFVVKDSYKEDFMDILNNPNLSIIAAKIRKHLETSDNLQFISSVMELDKYITSELANIWLAEYNFQVDVEKFNSFCTDYEMEVKRLEKEQPNEYTLFKSNEVDIILKYFTFSDTMETLVTEDQELNENKENIYKVIIKVKSAIIAVDYLFEELDMDLNFNSFNAMRYETAPEIFDIVKMIQKQNPNLGYYGLLTIDNHITRMYNNKVYHDVIIVQ